ncbi:CotH kinase family protein [Candidatus Pelagibacter sp.]|nr:CotH kinase family protein [Candidatus Pelagibacter sp.]
MFSFKKKKKKKEKILFSNFFHYFGIFSFFLFIFLFIYTIPFLKIGIDSYYFKENSFIDKVLSKVIGPAYFSANTPKKMFEYVKLSISENFNPQKIDKLELNINYENLQLLDNQRQRKISKTNWAKANALFVTEKEKKKSKIKLKAKGHREIHRKNLKEMSFKVDMIGNDRFYGLEEFSIQKPIVRNYSLEIIASNVMLINNILASKTRIIDLYLNGENLGIYHLEEGFSKEILELNKKKNGPIFGIEDGRSEFFPNIFFDVYSKSYWLKKNPEILNIARSKLEYIKHNYKNDDFNIFLYFDLNTWAKFFALSDALAAHHGAKMDSVKFFYNPTIERFEPIFFDGHINSGSSKTNIILSDFINLNTDIEADMGYLNSYKEWFQLFFNKRKNNREFLLKYSNELELSTKPKFQNQLNKIFDYIKPINRAYYSNFMPADGIWSKSILPFFFDKDFFLKRNDFIKSKLSELNLIILNMNTYAKKGNQNKISHNDLFNNEIINLVKNEYFLDDIKLLNKTIYFNNPVVLYLSGSNLIKDSIFKGPVMIVQRSGKLKVENSSFDSLRNINVKGTNWTGSINIINSYSEFTNVDLRNINAEDAINFVNSKGNLRNIEIQNSSSDAIDIDFGEFNFENLICREIKNDCLDVSNSTISGKNLAGYNVNDKVLSSGEKSLINIINFTSENSEIGVVSKDSSNVTIKNLKFKNTKLYGAVFKKKEMFDGTTYLKIDDKTLMLNNDLNNKFLVSIDSQLEINGRQLKSNYTSEEIENMMYGNIYGTKTSR